MGGRPWRHAAAKPRWQAHQRNTQVRHRYRLGHCGRGMGSFRSIAGATQLVGTGNHYTIFI